MELSIVGVLIAMSIFLSGRMFRIGLLGILPLSTLFSSTAVVSINFIGGAPLLVPTAVAAVIVVSHGSDALRRMKISVSKSQIFLIFIFFTYGMISAIFFPRIFDGATSVFSLSRSFDVFFSPIPLQPSSGNFSQLCYFTLDILLLIVISVRHSESALQDLDRGFDYASRFLAIIIFIELPLRYSGVADPFTFLRTANYELLTNIEIGSFKRLTGFSTESSSFGSQCSIFLAYSLIKYNLAPKSPLRLITVIMLTLGLMAATSSAGYVTFAFIVFMSTIRSIGDGFNKRIQPSEIYLFSLLSISAICLSLMILADFDFSALNDLFDALIFNKSSTSSGIERSQWNTQAIRNFFETYGFGTGLGSSRSSSFILSLLSNTGIFGTVTFAMIILQLFANLNQASIRLKAARFSIIVCLFSICLIGTVIDAGVLFYTLLGLGLAEVAAINSITTKTYNTNLNNLNKC